MCEEPGIRIRREQYRLIVRRARDSDSEGAVSVDCAESLGLGFRGYVSTGGLGFECGRGGCCRQVSRSQLSRSLEKFSRSLEKKFMVWRSAGYIRPVWVFLLHSFKLPGILALCSFSETRTHRVGQFLAIFRLSLALAHL